MRSSAKRFATLLPVALLALVLCAAKTQEPSLSPDEMIFGGQWPDPAKVRLSGDEMAFHTKASGQYESESAYFLAYFNDGWIFMSSLFTWSYGPMKKWGIYTLVSSPDGKRYWARDQIDEKLIKIAPDHLSFLQGANFVEGRDREYRVKFSIKGFACDLTFTNNVPPWRPGNGFSYSDAKKEFWQYTAPFSPWADVTGTITLPDRTLQVKGEGYADKARSTVAPTKLSPYIIDIRVFSPTGTPRNDRWFFGLLEYIMHPAFGAKRVPFIHLCHGDKIVFATKHYDLDMGDMTQGPNTPYKYPKRLKIRARERGYSLEGQYTCSNLFDFVDVMSELPGWVRAIVEKFVKRPVFFRSRGEFNGVFTTPDGKSTNIRLVGPTEYVVAK